MKMFPNTHRISWEKGHSSYSFLQSGDIFEFTCDGFLLNLFQGNGKEGSINNIWLRIYHNGVPAAYPLLGVRSSSQVLRGNNTLAFRGKVENVDYTVTFYAADDGIWLWNVELSGSTELADVIYGQDIGVAKKGAVLDNELYTAQYLGYSIQEGKNGYVVCARQNMPQDGANPYLQQGMIRGTAKAFSTDGMQFFGLSSKKAQLPEALNGDLASKAAQYEFSYTALQSESFSLKGTQEFLTFYGLFRSDHKEAVRSLEFTEDVYRALQKFEELHTEKQAPCQPLIIRNIFGPPYTSPEWTDAQVAAYFPVRKLEERQDGKLLSFFTENHAHVVLQQKELTAERPHGIVLTSLINEEKTDSNIITTTNFMFGVFNAQTAVGNTTFHKFISVHRGSFDLLQNSGQRIYIRLNGTFRLLTLPAVYSMGMNWAKWYYELPGDRLEIAAFCAAHSTDVVLEARSAKNISYDFMITSQLVGGASEFQLPIEVREEAGGRILRFSPEESAENPYPGLHYDLQMPGTDFTWSDDRIFFEDNQPQNGTLLTLSIVQKSNFQLVIQGRLEDCVPQTVGKIRFEEESKKAQDFYSRLNGGFHLEHTAGEKNDETEKLNETAWWYTHNAMVHYGAPHGLEQPGGAAWGVRDVCQGPMEFFLATQNNALARSVLLTVFSHQILETGEWPQWFMYDRYNQNAGNCHGDVILWPLKCIGDYLDATGDESILSELLPYRSMSGERIPGKPESILEHINLAASALENRFLPGTGLISYAGGDWDDTLQPVNESMKRNMTSSWTQALTYQTSKLLGRVLKASAPSLSSRFALLSQRTKAAFSDLQRDGVIAGFAIRRADGKLDFLLHPSDTVTGIHYRLLPMTRSIISELARPEETGGILNLIDDHLKFPDGVRLMDCPMEYDGGVSHIFQRAEQAANVGREISLQYTHAHIRYAEAMAKLGASDRAWDALLQVNPINIREVVPNAVPRQSNMYFSSSDGNFMNRYEYSRNFDQLRSGTVEVKGGWRLYSSGPGIYLHQLISNLLGIRFCSEGLILDPVLPARLDGLRFSYICFGCPTTFVYHIARNGTKKLTVVRNEKPLTGRMLSNSYRDAGILIQKQDFLAEDGEIHVLLP